MTPNQIVKNSVVPVETSALYNQNSLVPIPYGPLDRRMGLNTKEGICDTCGERSADCPGHFGYLKLVLPVFHIGFFRSILTTLQTICKSCGRVMIEDSDNKTRVLMSLKQQNMNSLRKGAIVKRNIELAKKCRICPFCDTENGSVKKIAPLKLAHFAYTDKTSELQAEFHHMVSACIKSDPEVEKSLKYAQDGISPIRAQKLFQMMPDDDAILVGFNPPYSRPDLMIMTHVPVPPCCIRPSVMTDASSGTNEDDLTMKIHEISQTNGFLKEHMRRGSQMAQVMETWDYLQLQCALHVNSELPGLPRGTVPVRPTRGLSQRLKGKQGRFRQNLSGKRVDFSGRTVISPDPNLRIDEVGVPQLIAMSLTFPERVTSLNKHIMMDLVRNGPNKYPGANFVKKTNGRQFMLQHGDREETAKRLQFGDIVERHLKTGDVVLFNRQPSLHRVSIMAHHARVMPYRTLRFNECVCTPYNADFDGDEMNIHLPQTQEARAEAEILMGVVYNLCTPRTGTPLIAATQDFLTASYLLTLKDSFFTERDFMQLVAGMFDGNVHVDLPSPAVLKPVRLYTGKQAVGLLVHPNRNDKCLLTFEMKEKMHSTSEKHMDVTDGYVCFRKSRLISGILGKSILGSGSRTGLFSQLRRLYGPTAAADCLVRLSKFSGRWLTNRGFSLGLMDVCPTQEVTDGKNEMVRVGYEKCDVLIEQFDTGKLEASPGCSPEETVEGSINGILSKIRDDAGLLCLRSLPNNNPPLIMAISGSKGSNINISQMVACVGQQIVSGHRIPNGFTNRSLPHFEKGSRQPVAKGFVSNSFYTGMDALEFFFHTMGGREGLVDTAVKTADTGYMQRRMMKALEDLKVEYDGTVRNAYGQVIEFCFGEDGVDPLEVDGAKGIDYERNWIHSITNVPPEGHPNENHMISQFQMKIEEKPFGKSEPDDGMMLDDPNNLFNSVNPNEQLTPEQIRQIVFTNRRTWETQLVHKIPQSILLSDDGRTKEEQDEVASDDKNVVFIDKLCTFINKKADNITNMLENLTISPDPTQQALCVQNINPAPTLGQFNSFLHNSIEMLSHSFIEPGTAVGAIAGQSIGEPGTQMTLKTFHFAGVASMNITLGVPRLKEIVNATQTISTPIITAPLVKPYDVISARIVKGRIEKTRLGDVASCIQSVIDGIGASIEIQLDVDTLSALQLEITLDSVADSIVNTPKMKIKHEHLSLVRDKSTIIIHPPKNTNDTLNYTIHILLTQLPNVVICGLPGIERSVISVREEDTNAERTAYHLLSEGTNLLGVMTTPGIDGYHTTCNHTNEISRVLGIEAARSSIVYEIDYTMKSHGITIDPHHTRLLGDIMTSTGEVLGITRFGIGKMKDSVMMLASFERTLDHLFDAAVHGRADEIEGVSECIILGKNIPIGTGSFGLVMDERQSKPFDQQSLQRKPLLSTERARLSSLSHKDLP
ncbi:putative DNA-directed RNA polymerase III subunit rpc1 [Blattamonas nauphoetae]|uniref:DNA-directed RNA polymerase subunit n=1 Tax=Blattamonas nauphoetae TaxID=2049346 RepID=A0ABQ9Y9H1_9EUKA|nr:putative DNA-directed RNA polymerase III subunit rpc1 [Blattamonas nauphoetae]